MFNKTELDIQRIEALWLLQVHNSRYVFLASNIAFSNSLILYLTYFSTDRQADKTKCFTQFMHAHIGTLTQSAHNSQ